MRRDLERLADIADAIAKIEQYAVQGKAAFLEQELIQTWMLYQLQVIGEAARGVSTEMMEQYPRFPWSDAIGLRNVLVHQYWKVELERVWMIVEQVIPELKVELQQIFEV